MRVRDGHRAERRRRARGGAPRRPRAAPSRPERRRDVPHARRRQVPAARHDRDRSELLRLQRLACAASVSIRPSDAPAQSAHSPRWASAGRRRPRRGRRPVQTRFRTQPPAAPRAGRRSRGPRSRRARPSRPGSGSRGAPTSTSSASSAFSISALTRVECTMPGSGSMPSTTSTSAPLAAARAERDDVLHQRLVVAGREQVLGQLARASAAAARGWCPSCTSAIEWSSTSRLAIGFTNATRTPLAIEGADEPEAGGGEPDAGGRQVRRARCAACASSVALARRALSDAAHDLGGIHGDHQFLVRRDDDGLRTRARR